MSENKAKTGTTCIGVLFKDGVVLAADRRITGGSIWSDSFSKLNTISDTIVATMAGHVADNVLGARVIAGEVKLIELKNERKALVREAAMLINSMQYSALRQSRAIISVILGGYDKKNGFELYNLQPDGTLTQDEPFVVDGSGSVFIKGIFQNEYKPNMSEKEVIALIEKGFMTSFRNDNASGGGYIAKVVTKEGINEVSRKLLKSELVNE